MKKIALFVYENRISIEIENGTSRTVAGKTFADVLAEMPDKDKAIMLAMAKEITEHCSTSQPNLKQVN